MSHPSRRVCRTVMRNRSTRVLTAIFITTAVAWSPAAEACSRFACSDPWSLLVPDGGTVAANVPGLVLSAADSSPRTIVNMLDAGVKLRGADGGLIDVIKTYDAARGQLVIAPRQPLAVGERYELRAPRLCENFTGAHDVFAQGVTTREAEALPTSVGALTVQSAGQQSMYVNQPGNCGTLLDAAFTRFDFTPDPSMATQLGVTRWVLEIDGVAWVSTRFGHFEDVNFPSFRSALAVHAGCTPADATDHRDHGLSLGAHSARLKAFVAGVDQPLATPALPFTLACDAAIGPDGGMASPQPTAPGCSSAPGGLIWLCLLLLRGLTPGPRSSRPQRPSLLSSSRCLRRPRSE